MNLFLYVSKLRKQGCCETVAFALQEYGHSRYARSDLVARVKGGDLGPLLLARHEDAIAALRCWARWTVWPPVRVALSILEPD